MAGSRSTRRELILRPTRWPGPPRGGTLLRVALIAGLLGLAAGVLYAEQAPPECAATGAGSRPSQLDRSGPLGRRRRAPPPTPATARRAAERAIRPPGCPCRPEMVGVPIRLAEPAALAVVRPGVRVDLLAVPAGTGPARPTDPTLLASRAPGSRRGRCRHGSRLSRALPGASTRSGPTGDRPTGGEPVRDHRPILSRLPVSPSVAGARRAVGRRWNPTTRPSPGRCRPRTARAAAGNHRR